MDITFLFNRTLTTAEGAQTFDIGFDNPAVKTGYKIKSYQVTATGAGTLKIETKMQGQSAFNVDASISGETVHIDMVGIDQIRLTATVADVPVTIAPSSANYQD